MQEGDVFGVLRKLRDEARNFDLIVLDPPNFAPTVTVRGKGPRAYKDINLLRSSCCARAGCSSPSPVPAASAPTVPENRRRCRARRRASMRASSTG